MKYENIGMKKNGTHILESIIPRYMNFYIEQWGIQHLKVNNGIALLILVS